MRTISLLKVSFTLMCLGSDEAFLLAHVMEKITLGYNLY